MKETGKILKVEEDKAIVEITPAEACTKCCSCSAAKTKTVSVELFGREALKAGDRVELDIEDGSMMKVYTILYVVPLTVFIASILIIYSAAASPIVSFAGAILLTGVTYTGIALYLKKNPACIPSATVKKI